MAEMDWLDDDPEPQPDAAHIARKRDWSLETWQRSRDQWSKVDAWLKGETPLWEVKGVNQHPGRPEVHPALAAAIVDHAVDNGMSYDPVVERIPASEKDRSQRNADKVEPFVRNALVAAGMEQPSLTFRQLLSNVTAYGYGVLEGAVINSIDRPRKPKQRSGETEDNFKKRLSLYENRKKTWLPFSIRAPHPSRVLLDPLNKRPQFAVKHQYWFAWQVEDYAKARVENRKRVGRDAIPVANEWKLAPESNPMDSVLCDEYWTKDWHAFVVVEGGSSVSDVGQGMVFCERNVWGFLPFGHAYSGWGKELVANDRFDPSCLTVGILDPVMQSLKSHAMVITALTNYVIEGGFPRRGTRLDAQEATDQLRSDVMSLTNKDDIWNVDAPQLPQWLLQVLEVLAQDIELGTYARSLAGQRDAGVVTVGQQLILSGAAGRKFIAPMRQVEHLATICAGSVLRLVDVIGEELYCQGAKLSPAQIEHDYSVNVRFEMRDPVMHLQQKELALREWQAGAISIDDYWAVAGYSDATEMRDRILLQRLRELPDMQMLMMERVSNRIGAQEMLEEIVKRQAQAGTLVDAQGRPLVGSSGGGGAMHGSVANMPPDRMAAAQAGGNQSMLNAAL